MWGWMGGWIGTCMEEWTEYLPTWMDGLQTRPKFDLQMRPYTYFSQQLAGLTTDLVTVCNGQTD